MQSGGSDRAAAAPPGVAVDGAAGRVLAAGALPFVGVLLVASNLRAAITVVGPLIPQVRADGGLTDAAAGVLTSIPLAAFAVMSPVAPALARRFGLERAIAAALVLLGLATVLRSLPAAPALWAGTLLIGAAVAVLNVVLPSIVKRDHPGHVGRITGVYSAVQGGVSALAAGLAVPIAGVGGWRLAFGIWAGLAVIALAVFLPGHRRSPALATPHPGTAPARSPWRTAAGWQVTAFMGLQSVCFFVFVTWWPSIEQSQGVAAGTAGWHLFGFQVLGVAGSLGSGVVMRRRGREPALAVASGLLVLIGALGELAAPAVSLVWIGASGLGCGISIVLALSLFGLRSTDPAQTAAMSGMAQTVGYLVATAGPPLVGVLHDGTGAWTVPLLVVAAVGVLQLGSGVVASRVPRPAQ